MEKLAAVVMVLVVALILALILAFPIMWLWNLCLVPAIPMLVKITFWQALGIKVLISLLSATSSKD
jgi:hypothetical protein